MNCDGEEIFLGGTFLSEYSNTDNHVQPGNLLQPNGYEQNDYMFPPICELGAPFSLLETV